MRTLSFGTVMDVLHQCKEDKYTKTDLTMAVINILIPNNPYSKYREHMKKQRFTRTLNFIYQCKNNLNAMFNNGEPLPNLELNESVIEQFDKNVGRLIKKDKCKPATHALCDMIEKDCTLNSKNTGENIEKFEAYIGKNIQEFLNDREYVFSEVLARICLYTLTEPNTVGSEWVKLLTEKHRTSYNNIDGTSKGYDKGFKDYVASFKNSEREIKVWCVFNDKKESHNTASKAVGSMAFPTSSEDDAINGKTCVQNTTSQTADSKAVHPLSKVNALGGEANMSNKKCTATAVQSFGAENEICLCCKRWIGNMENALGNPLGSLGMCTYYNKEMLSTNPMCEKSIPSIDRAVEHFRIKLKQYNRPHL